MQVLIKCITFAENNTDTTFLNVDIIKKIENFKKDKQKIISLQIELISMSEQSKFEYITSYITELNRIYKLGNATEHSYQTVQKWLKDRKGRELNFDEIKHYQKIIVALNMTDEIMKKIDEYFLNN